MRGRRSRVEDGAASQEAVLFFSDKVRYNIRINSRPNGGLKGGGAHLRTALVVLVMLEL